MLLCIACVYLCYDRDMVFFGGKVITVNAGSSSIKVETFKAEAGMASSECSISIIDIGQVTSRIWIKNKAGLETMRQISLNIHCCSCGCVTSIAVPSAWSVVCEAVL